MKISIIIPIYKVEAYLRECVDSVLNQTYRDLEIILVDDGSPDGCPAICDEYGQKDSRVKVIHKPNGGLSDARNVGLQSATGDYVVFLDSDDYYNNKEFIARAAEKLAANPVDFLCHQRQKFVDGHDDQMKQPRPYSQEEENEHDYGTLVEKLSTHDHLDASACMKVIRCQFLIENQLWFKKGMYSEDVDWYMRVLLMAKSMSVTNDKAYCYRLRAGSISHSLKLKNLQDLFSSVENYAEQARKISNHELGNGILNYLAYQYFIVMGLTSAFLKGDEKKYMLEKVKKYKWVTKYASSLKTQKSVKLLMLCGFKITSFILSCYIKARA